MAPAWFPVADPMMKLSQEIESLYHAFADVAKPRAIDACPCCVEEKNLCTLLTKPLRDLSPEELSAYASSAFLTSGDVPDYLYFLPRILEISVTDDSWWPDCEVTGRAIANTTPLAWPALRLQALNDFFHSLIARLIEESASGSSIDSWMCAIGRMGIDVAPFLAQIGRSPSSVLAYYQINASELEQRHLANAFWERSDAAYNQIIDWFGSEPISDIILRAYGVALYRKK